MKDISFFPKIFLATDFVDFRKQAHGLSIIVKNHLEMNPISEKTLFVFANKRKNAVKLLYWDLTGYALWVKRLEKYTFKWPKSNDSNKIYLSSKELKWLLDGVDLSKIKSHKKIILD